MALPTRFTPLLHTHHQAIYLLAINLLYMIQEVLDVSEAPNSPTPSKTSLRKRLIKAFKRLVQD